MILNQSPLSTMAYAEQTWIDGRKYFDRADDLAERNRIDNERARLIAKILPERVKALAAKKDRAADAQEAGKPDAAAHADDLARHASSRSPYHDAEPVHACTEEHR